MTGQYKKVLGLWDSVAVITAIVIGAGIFKVPSSVASLIPLPTLILLAWLTGGIISLLGALCYAELSSSFPKNGGTYVYLRKSYGRLIAFLYGWTELMVVRTGSIAAVGFIAGSYITSFFGMDEIYTKPLAILVILTITLINILGLSISKNLHNAVTIIIISLLLAMMAVGFTSGKGNIENFNSIPLTGDVNLLSSFGLALIPVLWTYGGWHENTFVAEETRDPVHTLPKALMIGISLVTFLYVGVNALYLYLVPLNMIISSTVTGSEVFNILFGKGGSKVSEMAVIFGSIGSINALLITGSRITYVMAQENTIFVFLEKMNLRFETPYRSLIINGVWASILVLMGTFTQLLFFTGILVWIFFGLVGIGLIILRRKLPKIERPYKVAGYPLTPLLFVAVCFALFINTLVENPFPSLAGIGILMSGLPFYYFINKDKKKYVLRMHRRMPGK